MRVTRAKLLALLRHINELQQQVLGMLQQGEEQEEQEPDEELDPRFEEEDSPPRRPAQPGRYKPEEPQESSNEKLRREFITAATEAARADGVALTQDDLQEICEENGIAWNRGGNIRFAMVKRKQWFQIGKPPRAEYTTDEALARKRAHELGVDYEGGRK